MTTYKATAERDGRFWLIRIPTLDGATQARTLTEIPDMVRDYVAIVTEEEAETIDVEVEIVLPGVVREHIDRAEKLRAEEAEARAAAAREIRAAARELHDSKFTVRDIGEALGVSYQRAHQLLAEPRTDPTRARTGTSRQPARERRMSALR